MVSRMVAAGALVVQRQEVTNDQQFKAAVDSSAWDSAIQYLSRLSPDEIKKRTDSLAIEKCLGMLGAVPSDQHKVRAALLDRAYLDAKSKGEWEKAAEYLNGFNMDDIKARLADPSMSAQNLKLLAKGTRNKFGGSAEYLLKPIRDALRAQPGQVFGKVAFTATPTDGGRGGGCNKATDWQCHAVITFDPDPDVVDADSIAFVQTIRMVETGTNDSEDDRKGISERLNAKNQAVDRDRLNKSGWYGYYNDGRHPMVVEGSSHPPTQAKMEDTPGQTTRKAGTTWDFETSIIAKAGKDENLVYSVVLWGFTVNSDLKVSLKQHSVRDVPTSDFGSAVSAWNKQAAGPAGNRSDPNQGKLPTFR
jgi:hypothetical protein